MEDNTPKLSQQSATAPLHFEDQDLIKLRPSLKKPTNHSKFPLRAPDEAKNYDFAGARKSTTKTLDIGESMMHLAKGALGAGAVSIHESYKDCGLWTALGLNVIVGFSVGWFMYTLVRSAQKLYGMIGVPQLTYPELVEAAVEIGPCAALRKRSKCFRYVLEIVIAIDLFGACCVYQIIVARALKQLVDGSPTVFGPGIEPYIRIYVGSLLLPCMLLSMITSLKFMAPFSLVANLFMVILAIQTVNYGYLSAKTSPLEFPAFKSVPGLFEFLGVCAFSVDSVGTTMPIENHMEEPKKFYLVIAGGMTIVTSLVMAIGFFGCWGFGENAASPVTINFPWVSFAITLKVFMILATYVTFTINYWVAFEVVWHYLKMNHPPARYWFWERVYRTLLVVLVTGVACAFPNVPKFVGFLGCFCISIMVFIYPAFVELCLDWLDPGLGFLWWRLWRFILILVASLVVLVYGSYTSCTGLIEDVF